MDLLPENVGLLYTPPFKDESLTSWVYRLANAHFTDVKTYFVDRIESTVLNRTDFDTLKNISLLTELTRATPLSTKELIVLTLCRQELVPFKTLLDRRFIPWLLPRSNKHLKSFGLQICPSCWSKESVAYHRIQWRLSLFFFCSKCGVYLLDHCPSCQNPIVYIQMSNLRFVEDPLDLNRRCFHCSSDLSLFKAIPLSQKDSETAKRVLGLFESTKNLPCSPEDYLVVLHYFTQRAFSEYLRQNNRLYPIQKRDRSRFLEVNSAIRADLIAKAFEMFDDFPEIIERSRKNHLSVKAFWLRGFVACPIWYINLLEKHS